MMHALRPLHGSAGITECSTLEVEARFSYPGMLFVYGEKLDAERLRNTLSRVLDDFPEYASKLVPSVVTMQLHHGAVAATFETVYTSRSIAEIRSALRIRRCAELEPQVSTLRIVRSREATLLVRLTEAKDGCVLAVGWNHAVGDMHSTMLLLRAWADAYAGRTYPKPMRVPDRDAYLRTVIPNHNTARSVTRRTNLFGAIANRLGFLRPATQVNTDFSSAELTALQHALGGPSRITQNDALCAHVYSALRRMSGNTKPSNLCLVVNYRKRLGLPDRVIGNMTSLLCVPVRAHESAGYMASGIRTALGEYASKHVYYHPTARELRECSSHAERLRLISDQFAPGSGDLLITNWNSFDTYTLKFGSSAPLSFHPICLGAAQLPQWFMLVYELPRSQGVTVTVGLPKQVAARWSSVEGQALLHTKPRYEPSAICPERSAHIERVSALHAR